MRRIVLFLFVTFCASFLACSQKGAVSIPEKSEPPARTYTHRGKTITYTVKIFRPPIIIRADEARMNQESAINCSLLFHSRLAKGDIAGAAGLGSDPDETKLLLTGLKEREGEDGLKKVASAYFNDTSTFKYEFVIGDHHLLVFDEMGKGLAAQPYVRVGDKFFQDWLRSDSPSAEVKDLYVLFNALRDGKLKLE